MPNPRLASRYAKSLIDLANEKGQVEQVHNDMQWLKAVCKSNRDFVNLLRSPIIKGGVKQKIMTAVTQGHLGPLTEGFNKLLIAKNRESNLPEIVTAFINLYKEQKQIKTIKLTTAAPVSDAVKQSIISQVKSTGGFKEVEMEEKVDENIIGGFVLQVDDNLIDASVAYDLKQIAKQFDNNDFIYKIK
jgi:F-type H+-transporting ATPase subunit delta